MRDPIQTAEILEAQADELRARSSALMGEGSLCLAVCIRERAVCARAPWTLTRTRSVPWQPASMSPPVGSPKFATSASSQSGNSASITPSPLYSAAISSQS